MKKHQAFLALCYLLLSPSIVSAQKTEIQYLSGTDKDHTVSWDFLCSHGRNSNKWTTIQVPSQWEQQGFGSYLYGNVNLEANEKGFYKYRFSVPKNWKNKKVDLVFEGSMTDTEVKVNGTLAGAIHQGAFYPFKYDVSKLIRYDTQNLLEVVVCKESSNESVNKAERISDYWVFGGLYRPVYLQCRPESCIERVAIDAKADGSFSMDVYTENATEKNTIEAQIETLDGQKIGRTLHSDDGADKRMVKGNIQDPKQWNPEDPTMYQVVVRLKKGKKTVHEITQKFGFRSIELKPNDGFYLNGKKIMFKGVCRHTFTPQTGRTSSKQVAIDDVKLMKEMNMNAVRMSHYPPDQYFLDVCDSLGLFVLDELAGWQKKYDTPTAKRLIKATVTRDVNHPSIVIWDNGNEGGFNQEARPDFALWDPQNRTVIEPWSQVNGTDTKHYPQYNYVWNALNKANLVYFPTEFLHGLYDGGHGAGLDDYWNLMLSKPLSAGGFLWVFADEGIERRDKNDSIDTNGNFAPDGILGPNHEKEGSFFTIKEIWSPVYFGQTALPTDFNGKLSVNNRYLFSNLKDCSFSFELTRFKQPFANLTIEKMTGFIQSPDIAAGDSGFVQLNLPFDWKKYDVLYVTAVDKYKQTINTWSWNIRTPAETASELVVKDQSKVEKTATNDRITLESGATSVSFCPKNGRITHVNNHGKTVSFSNGPQFTGFKTSLKELKQYTTLEGQVVELVYDSLCAAKWTMLPGGWLKLDYSYRLKGSFDFTGITFSYPENKVKGACLMANGPYHVWKNRLKGTQFGVFNKTYNNTVTGQTFDYPEFKGYYANFYGVKIETTEIPITIVSGNDRLFLHLLTPDKPIYSKGGVYPPFPSGNISILDGISPIGTKFSNAENEGPQGQKNIKDGSLFSSTIYFKFGE